MLIQDVPFKTLGYYQKLLLRKETININTINDYPLNAIAEREWIKKHGFRSLLFVPMLSKNKLYGAVGFTGEIGKSIMWPSVFIELLKSISSILISTLESNKAEQKLRESEQKYRELVNNANSIIIKLDKDANIVFINEYGEKFFEYNEAEILGRNVIGTIVSKTESSGRDLQQMVNEVFQYPERFERNENENITKSGKKVWVSWANKAIKDENDKFIGILSVGTDITEKKRTNLKLKESEEKFKNITEQNLMGIIILQDNVIKYTNKAMADIYGYTIEEALNWEPMEFFKFVAPDSLKIAREQALKKQSGDPSQLVQYIIHGVKKSGELIWIDNFSRTINYEGHPADLVVQIDITEKMKAEKIIQNEIVQLKKIDEIKNDLIRRISHELNTPLISIYSTSTMIIDHFSNRLDDDLLSLIQIIKNGGERLKNLFDNLIDVYFIESKQIIIKLKQVNLAIEIKNALEKINSIIVDRRHKVITELPDECLRKIDKVHFKKAITNLLSNAAKFTPPGGIIKIELLETEKNIELRVQDNGIGFTSEEKQTIFTKFGKIERYGKGYDVDIEGPGLGLYLAYELISLNGGKLSLNSEGYNKGSTFIIRFKK
jgi:PAS domain S-box-containing protein